MIEPLIPPAPDLVAWRPGSCRPVLKIDGWFMAWSNEAGTGPADSGTATAERALQFHRKEIGPGPDDRQTMSSPALVNFTRMVLWKGMKREITAMASDTTNSHPRISFSASSRLCCCSVVWSEPVASCTASL